MGIIEIIQEIFQELIDELRTLASQHLAFRDPRQAREDELRRMYGRGLVDRERFIELLGMLRQGKIGRGDLMVAAREGSARLAEAGGEPWQTGFAMRFDSALVDPLQRHAIDQLYVNRGRLVEVQAETHAAVQELSDRLSRLERRADTLAEEAKAVLPDEDRARVLLGARIEAQERAARLEQLLVRLRAGLERLASLDEEMDVIESELAAGQIEMNMAEFELETQGAASRLEARLTGRLD